VTSSTHSRHASTYSISTIQNPYDTPTSKTKNPISRKSISASMSSVPVSNQMNDPTAEAEGFHLEKPSSIYEIDNMFRGLMEKRDFKSLPPSAKQEMINYNPDKKWMLIYQDALTEYNRHKKVILLSHEANSSSPEFYSKKLLEKSITAQQLKDLWVSLRTEPLDWVRRFIYDCQGDALLSAYLLKLQEEMTQKEYSDVNDEIFERELNVLKSLKSMMNQKLGAERVRTDVKLYVTAVSGSLLSPRIVTRRIAAESLTFMIAYFSEAGEDQSRYHKILKALDSIPERAYFEYEAEPSMGINRSKSKKLTRKAPHPERYKRFELWLQLVEKTIDGKGKYMNSLVGASDEYRSANIGSTTSNENNLLEYSLGTMLLINTIVQYGLDNRVRIHLRAQFNAAGLDRLIRKFQDLNYESLNQQCLNYLESAEQDELEFKESQNLHENVDFNNPIELVKSLWNGVQNSESQGYFLSAIQHLYLNQAEKRNNNEEMARSMRLLDGLIQNVSMAHTTQEDTAIGIAINRLYSGMSTDAMYREALDELKSYKKIAMEAQAERDEMSKQLSMGADGLINNLQNEIREQQTVLQRTRRFNDELTEELEELKTQHLLEKQQQELEMRELLIMLNNEAVIDAKRKDRDAKTTVSIKTTNEQLVKKLQKQIHRKKAEYKLDNRKFGTQVEPSSRLRALREQMGDIENMARELEMTDFETYVDPTSDDVKSAESVSAITFNSDDVGEEQVQEAEPEVESDSELESEPEQTIPLRSCKVEDLEKLDSLRKKLTSLQSESNDIMKFNNNAMFQKQKLLAMDRLKELENNFKNFNLNFDDNANKDDDFSFDSEYVDPNIKRRIKEEFEEIEQLKQELRRKLAVVDEQQKKTNRASHPTLKKLEARFAQGKVGPAPDENETRLVSPGRGKGYKSNRQVSISGMNPKFLQELSYKVNKSSPIEEVDQVQNELDNTIDENDSARSSSVITPVPPAPELPLVREGEPKDLSTPPPPPPPPAPSLPPMFGGKSTLPVPPAPPAPPAPSLPPMFDENMGTKSPTPPPPPPAPPLNGSVPPPPPPPPPLPFDKPTRVEEPVTLTENIRIQDNFPRPKKKLKQLHWEKFEASSGNSFWDNSNTNTLISDLQSRGVLDEIEIIFAAKEIKKLATTKKEDIDKISFLNRDISQQFSINLHAFSSTSDEELVIKVLRCDKDVINNISVLEFLGKDEVTEVTNTLARNFEPYSTDYKIQPNSKPEKDPNELQRPDRLYLELMYNLQHYWKSRIRALTMMATYEKDYEDLISKLRSIDRVVDSINKSNNLRTVFEIILSVGNYMNDYTKQAQGFKLSSLQRLSFIKDDKNSMTLLHYVEKIIRQQYPEVLAFIDELSKCSEISKYSIEAIENDCKTYAQVIKNVQSSIDVGNLSDVSKLHPQERVLKVVMPLLSKAQRKADLLNDQSKCTLKEFDKTMRYFGEDPTDPFVRNSFVGKFSSFIKDFKKAQMENKKREEELRVYEQRKKLLETPKMPKTADNKDQQRESEDNVMDSLLEKLKAAGSTKADISSARKRAIMRKHMLESHKKKASSTPTKEMTISNSSFDSQEEFSPSEETFNTKSERLSPKDESHPENGNSPINDKDLGSRARSLLNELRGASEGAQSERVSAAQRFRNERLKKKQPTTSLPDTTNQTDEDLKEQNDENQEEFDNPQETNEHIDIE
jgi:cytokinesis protein